MKKTFFSGIFLYLLLLPLPLSSLPLTESEKAIKLFNMDTGYLLKSGEKEVGIGILAFGIGNRLEISTNTLMDALTLVNGTVKVGFLEETGGIPAVSMGAGYFKWLALGLLIDVYTDSANNEFPDDMPSDYTSNLWGYKAFFSMSKTLAPALHGHASIQIGRVESRIESVPGEDDRIGIKAEGGKAYYSPYWAVDLGSKTKLIAESRFDSFDHKVRWTFGVRLGAGKGRLQLGATVPGIKLEETTLSVVPHFRLYARF